MSFRRVCLFVLVMPAVAIAQANRKFETFTSKEEGFSVLFPGKAKQETKKVPSPLGELTMKMFGTETEDRKSAWMVISTDYPANTVKPANQEALLDGGVKGAIQSSKGKLLKQGKVTLDNKYPGRTLEVEVANTGILQARFYLVGDRLYQILVAGPKEVSSSPEATTFLDSFKLTK